VKAASCGRTPGGRRAPGRLEGGRTGGAGRGKADSGRPEGRLPWPEKGSGAKRRSERATGCPGARKAWSAPEGPGDREAWTGPEGPGDREAWSAPEGPGDRKAWTGPEGPGDRKAWTGPEGPGDREAWTGPEGPGDREAWTGPEGPGDREAWTGPEGPGDRKAWTGPEGPGDRKAWTGPDAGEARKPCQAGRPNGWSGTRVQKGRKPGQARKAGNLKGLWPRGQKPEPRKPGLPAARKGRGPEGQQAERTGYPEGGAAVFRQILEGTGETNAERARRWRNKGADFKISKNQASESDKNVRYFAPQDDRIRFRPAAAPDTSSFIPPAGPGKGGPGRTSSGKATAEQDMRRPVPRRTRRTGPGRRCPDTEDFGFFQGCGGPQRGKGVRRKGREDVPAIRPRAGAERKAVPEAVFRVRRLRTERKADGKQNLAGPKGKRPTRRRDRGRLKDRRQRKPGANRTKGTRLKGKARKGQRERFGHYKGKGPDRTRQKAKV
jgi:hypothetical protein